MNGSTRRDPKFAAALSVGLLLIFFGVTFLLDQMKIADSRTVWHQWPLIVLGIGMLHLWRTHWLEIGGHAMVATGVAFELGHLTHRGFHQLWPLIIVWVGVVFVLRAIQARKTD